ncbi:MAG: hypothetical protein BMS9Abin32_322 [Gammaproteobacteria bacterium]|nr:MAG: hypothetical protein BMS9Abin32_322 [Gammaproteobacteria bacterium]
MQSGQLLDELRRQLEAGDLSAADILPLLGGAKPAGTGGALASRLSVVLYYIGGGVVFLGMVFLIAQEWRHFGAAMKIFVTLGSGIAAFVVGVLLSQHRRLGAAGPAFFLLSAMLLPAGLFVAYDEAGINLDILLVEILVAGALSTVYTASYLLFRHNVLLVFAILFATWLLFALTSYLPGGAPVFDEYAFANYRILCTGIAYMFLGHAFSATDRAPLSGWLYAFGVMGFLGAGLALGEWKPRQNIFWEAVYPGLVLGVIFLSTHLRSRAFLVFGSLALGVYLTKITAEYFSDSLGWAFSLVLVGFLLMGVAYLAIRIKRQYIAH